MIGDTCRFWWDPYRRKYIGDVKFVLPGTIRCRGMMESDDLEHWTRPHPTLAARNPDHQIYGHTAFPYEGMYIGVRWIYEPEHPNVNHCMGVELDCSRDAKYWTRVGAGQPFMALDLDGPAWDGEQVKITSMLRVGDELWLYYAANRGYMSTSKAHTGLAKLRLDGFVSINAGAKAGRLLTRPLGFAGRHLHVNAAVASRRRATCRLRQPRWHFRRGVLARRLPADQGRRYRYARAVAGRPRHSRSRARRCASGLPATQRQALFVSGERLSHPKRLDSLA